MPQPTLYHVPRTISSPLVQLALELNLVQDGLLNVQELSFADLKSPKHLAINTMGTSPAFRCTEHGLCMWESGAILDFLLELHDPEGRFHPPPTTPSSSTEQLQKRTKYLHVKQFILATVYPFLASMYIHTLQAGGTLDKEYLQAAKQKCHACMGPALASFLGEGPYFLGERVSAIDFLAAKPLGNADSMGLLSDFPRLKALLERIRARPTYERAYVSLLLEAGMPVVESSAPEPDDQELVLVPKRKDKESSPEKENQKPLVGLNEVEC